MRNFNGKLMTILAVAAMGLATTSAFANGNKGGKKGGIGLSFGGGGIGVSLGNSKHNNSNYNNNLYLKKHNAHCGNYGGYPGYPVYPYVQPYGMAYEPFHSWYICQPGDSFYTVSLKEYGNSGAANYISRFNRLPFNAALVTGQRLMLPSVSPNGMMVQSRAPAPFVDATPGVGVTNPTAKFTQPNSVTPTSLASSVAVAATEPALPSIAVGSTLVLDGQVFGETTGVARLRIGGLSLPIEVLEWTNTSAKIRLPEVDLTSPMKAEIEVLRADGSVASTTAVELKASADRLARGN
jgi:hypothetical protein